MNNGGSEKRKKLGKAMIVFGAILCMVLPAALLLVDGHINFAALWIPVLFYGIPGIYLITAGLACRRNLRWGFTSGKAFSWMLLLFFPIGTLISVFYLMPLITPEDKKPQ